MGCVDAFPCKTEKAREVVRLLITEIIPLFSLQSENDPAFEAQVTQVRGSLEAWGQIVFSTVLGGSNNLVR
jgi:hypothetical protein